MPELILRSGKRAGKRIPLPGAEVVIGRDEGCHIRLTSSDVSRRHCLLRCEGDDVVVADLGSRNGTHINDVPISGPTPLRPGDRLRVGPFLFQLPGGDSDESSDADISGWLTEEGTLSGDPPAGVSNDTSLVPDLKGGSQKTTTELRLVPAAEEASAQAAEPPPPADPVVTQATQVIREYWATKKKR